MSEDSGWRAKVDSKLAEHERAISDQRQRHDEQQRAHADSTQQTRTQTANDITRLATILGSRLDGQDAEMRAVKSDVASVKTDVGNVKSETDKQTGKINEILITLARWTGSIGAARFMAVSGVALLAIIIGGIVWLIQAIVAMQQQLQLPHH